MFKGKKYFSAEEKALAKREANRRYFERNRHDPSYKKRRRECSNDWYHRDKAVLQKENPKKLMLRRIVNKAKPRGLECTITEDDFDLPEYCPVLGIKLEFNEHWKQDNSPTIDRIDNTKGYIPGNVQVISYRANWCKSDMSFEEIEKLYLHVLKQKQKFQV